MIIQREDGYPSFPSLIRSGYGLISLINWNYCNSGNGSQQRRYECTICKRNFKSKSHIAYHERCKTGVDPFRCEKCDIGFRSKLGYENHLRHHDNPKKRRTDIQVFLPWSHFNPARYENHLHVKIQVNPIGQFKNYNSGYGSNHGRYECTISKLNFKSNSHIAYHERCKTGVDPFRCEKCDVGFRSKLGYEYHLRHHCNPKKRGRISKFSFPDHISILQGMNYPHSEYSLTYLVFLTVNSSYINYSASNSLPVWNLYETIPKEKYNHIQTL